MEKIVVSAKYKGGTKLFTHGESYLISISQTNDGCVNVTNLKTQGNRYTFDTPTEHYLSIHSFLCCWEEISSYPTLSISE